MLNRDIVNATIGKTFADKLDEVVFAVSDTLTFSRRDMIEVLKCGNFNAATRLEKALKKLGIKTPAQLYKLDPFSLVRIRSIGETSLYVAMCILDSAGYDVVKWWGWHDTNTVKFASFKRDAIKRARKKQHEI